MRSVAILVPTKDAAGRRIVQAYNDKMVDALRDAVRAASEELVPDRKDVQITIAAYDAWKANDADDKPAAFDGDPIGYKQVAEDSADVVDALAADEATAIAHFNNGADLYARSRLRSALSKATKPIKSARLSAMVKTWLQAERGADVKAHVAAGDYAVWAASMTQTALDAIGDEAAQRAFCQTYGI